MPRASVCSPSCGSGFAYEKVNRGQTRYESEASAIMDTPFTPVTDPQELDTLWDASHEAPVLLFKHDPYCGISAHAHAELSTLDGAIPTIDVAHDRAIAKAVTERTGVRHESPQVILLRDGRPVWSASHFSITAAAVSDALSHAAQIPVAH
jgi:bacillithiol system protein YtxJ